jgi:hypothetical protein
VPNHKDRPLAISGHRCHSKALPGGTLKRKVLGHRASSLVGNLRETESFTTIPARPSQSCSP